MRPATQQARWMMLALAVAAVAFPLTLAAQEEDRDKKEERVERSNREPATLQITNENWQEVRVYAVRSGTRVRLGSAPSFKTVTIELPRWVVSSSRVRFLVVPLASSGRLYTDEITIWPGDLVIWDVRNNLSLSTLRVFGT